MDNLVKAPYQQREQKETAMTIPIELPPFFETESFSPCVKSKYCEIYQVREQCAESILGFTGMANPVLEIILNLNPAVWIFGRENQKKSYSVAC